MFSKYLKCLNVSLWKDKVGKESEHPWMLTVCFLVLGVTIIDLIWPPTSIWGRGQFQSSWHPIICRNVRLSWDYSAALDQVGMCFQGIIPNTTKLHKNSWFFQKTDRDIFELPGETNSFSVFVSNNKGRADLRTVSCWGWHRYWLKKPPSGVRKWSYTSKNPLMWWKCPSLFKNPAPMVECSDSFIL